MSFLKSKLFEWSEKLKITASERRAILFLLCLYTLIKLTNTLLIGENEGISRLEEVKNPLAMTPVLSPKDVKASNIADSLEIEQFQSELNVVQNNRIDSVFKHSATSTNNQPKIVDINTATEQQLITLPGIGPAYAKRIIAWRTEHGTFTSKKQLLQVKGIGPARLKKLSEHIQLSTMESN